MTGLAFVLLGAGWVLWLAPFIRTAHAGRATTVNRRARWGIALQGVSYAILWRGPFWVRQFGWWRIAGETIGLACACALSWTATRALGRHFRVDAGLSADHTLVRSGPYRLVRHPIYTSMLCVLLGTGVTVAPWTLFALAFVVFVVGTEIRVRIEDALLAGRFGDEFFRYRAAVRAYIPLVR